MVNLLYNVGLYLNSLLLGPWRNAPSKVVLIGIIFLVVFVLRFLWKSAGIASLAFSAATLAAVLHMALVVALKGLGPLVFAGLIEHWLFYLLLAFPLAFVAKQLKWGRTLSPFPSDRA
ncbi:hypothetical protein [Brevundimonas sp.]|uniref:hypothetical protein n=1 Tax=Brevundimonas sp. TaxID=1871086 RepID=UPI003F726EFB